MSNMRPRTSLLQMLSNTAGSGPPFPTRQLFVLGMQSDAPFVAGSMANPITALCRICEPIAFMSIFPYIYYMVKSFEITNNERQIALYAGMVTSAFAMCEFAASIFWGRLSDRVGRKPILLTGLAGTGVSMVIFGFARSLPVALFARAVGGILNGYVHVTYRKYSSNHQADNCIVILGSFKLPWQKWLRMRRINVSDYITDRGVLVMWHVTNAKQLERFPSCHLHGVSGRRAVLISNICELTKW